MSRLQVMIGGTLLTLGLLCCEAKMVVLEAPLSHNNHNNHNQHFYHDNTETVKTEMVLLTGSDRHLNLDGEPTETDVDRVKDPNWQHLIKEEAPIYPGSLSLAGEKNFRRRRSIKSIPSPTNPTPSPTNPTSSPTKSTPSPTNPTSSPTKSTPSPTNPTSSPTKSTLPYMNPTSSSTVHPPLRIPPPPLQPSPPSPTNPTSSLQPSLTPSYQSHLLLLLLPPISLLPLPIFPPLYQPIT
ncbi:hypothetical protein Hamer_G009684 [Homarus americanus]|uniref:Uncharacterized protein n=1 Tax=Homarus americanus TaxID=6706 RepID=A0A8J5T304_HOMAM|nr:hypothetical protein Hamer_G009684 [Homarus americanus]